MNAILSSLVDSLSDMTQNPVSLTIFSFLLLVIISLILAMIIPSVRDLLVRIKLLEEDEAPSSLLIWIITIVLIVKLLQTFVIQPFVVDGPSMLPTYHNKDFLIVDKLSYRIGDPHRGDVMVFKLYEKNNPFEGKHLIKRVIGLPNERVVVESGVTKIYNENNKNGFILLEPYITSKNTLKNIDVTLDEHQYFMMGDNRDQSYDSRDWGALDETAIRGQVLFRVYPFKDAGYEPGRYIFSK